MQNRPNFRREKYAFTLHPAFPVHWGVYTLTDRPITTLHTHNCFEVGFCHAGAGIFVVEDKTLPFRAGEVSVISEVELHLAQSALGTVGAWTFIYFDPRALIPAPPEDRWLLRTEPFVGTAFHNIFSPAQHPAVVHAVRTMVDELQARGPSYQSAVRASAWMLMLALHRVTGTAATGWTGAAADSSIAPIARALEVIATGYMQPLRVADLADACHYSVTHFRRLFTAALGQSPQHYLTQFRLRMATTQLTQTDHAIADIASAVGYATLSSFNRHFKELFGVSPRAWQRGQRASTGR